jgi:hypothetical protein
MNDHDRSAPSDSKLTVRAIALRATFGSVSAAWVSDDQPGGGRNAMGA